MRSETDAVAAQRGPHSAEGEGDQGARRDAGLTGEERGGGHDRDDSLGDRDHAGVACMASRGSSDRGTASPPEGAAREMVLDPAQAGAVPSREAWVEMGPTCAASP